MRLPALLLVPVLACGLATVGCRGRQQPPPEPVPAAPAAPVTGWTEELTTSAVPPLVEALTGHGWVTRFRETNGRLPVVEVTPFTDRSNDNVPVDELADGFLKALAGSDRVLTASSGQVADVTLSGVIGLAGGDYTIDTRVVDKKTEEVLWVTGITRQKPAAP